VCPTAPDTLRAFPYVDTDPFVMLQAPHVYFAGNQEEYGERLVTSGLTTCKQAVKILSVPIFRKSKSIVLLDVTSLQSYEVKFDLSHGIMPTRDSAMEVDQA
jgi:DNA polymerase delta subunit 2